VFWVCLFCAWTFSTLLGFVLLPINRGDLDVPKIVIIVLYVKQSTTKLDRWKLISVPLRSGFFGLFTFIMLATHIRLILLNMTTVERMRIQDMKEHESAMLADMYSMCAFAKKRRTRAEWDEEWGRPMIEGNIWWLGSGRKNWESVMGQSIWSWFREFHSSIVLVHLFNLSFYFKFRSAKRRATA